MLMSDVSSPFLLTTPNPKLMLPPWNPGDTPDERAARARAYERLAAAARRTGTPLEQLHGLLRQVARNEEETRRFLAEEVYGVPDPLLDDLMRVRLLDLESGG
jgi:hypothetical protein